MGAFCDGYNHGDSYNIKNSRKNLRKAIGSIYTYDREIREKLLKDLRADKNNIKIINELDINGAIADLAVISKDYFCGYEIKSDRDTLKRLPGQIQIYSYVFDKITIVIGESKFFNTIEIIPNFWGVIMAESRNGKIILTEVRKPKLNTNINKNWLSKKLWRSDIVDILKELNLYKGKSGFYKDALLEILMGKISLNELRHHIRAVLTKRIY